MRKTLFYALLLIITIHQNVFLEELKWEEKKGDHFVVYHGGSDRSFAGKVLWKAEKDYLRIARSFGYSRHSNFWTWKNRVKIYIYPDRSSYVLGTGMPKWSGGSAFYQEKMIASFTRSDRFLDSILPHEMAHLIFRDFVGFKGEVPLWLDEGVAQWGEKTRIDDIKSGMDVFLAKGTLLRLEDLTKIDIRKIKKNDQMRYISALSDNNNNTYMYLKGDELIQLFYYQAGSLVSFLAERFGIDKFSQFCRELRDGESLNKALKSTYATRINNLSDLEQVWFEYIGVEKSYYTN